MLQLANTKNDSLDGLRHVPSDYLEVVGLKQATALHDDNLSQTVNQSRQQQPPPPAVESQHSIAPPKCCSIVQFTPRCAYCGDELPNVGIYGLLTHCEQKIEHYTARAMRPERSEQEKQSDRASVARWACQYEALCELVQTVQATEGQGAVG